ncbi:MAG: sulfite exporter TauE/SafE family protein [Ruminococcaceae bacterium]|nr:sulfite exporter TauE/SafE family protein [Oscillospiraceae bacterium]
MELGWQELVLLALIAMGGGFVQRVTGFGLGIFVMLFLPFLFSAHTEAAAISTLFSCGASTYNAIHYRKKIPFKTVLPALIAALITIPIAVMFAKYVKADVFDILLGSVLILLSIYFLFFNRHIKLKPTVPNGIIAGTFGGVLTGLFSTGGPPIVLYLTNATEDPMVYLAATQFYFAVTGLYATGTRAVNGILTWELLLYAAIGMVGCMSGNLLGKCVFDKLNPKRLKQIVYLAMIVSGLLMIFKAIVK